MDVLLKDVRYTIRSPWKAPEFSLAAIMTLALGIGVNQSETRAVPLYVPHSGRR